MPQTYLSTTFLGKNPKLAQLRLSCTYYSKCEYLVIYFCKESKFSTEYLQNIYYMQLCGVMWNFFLEFDTN